MAAGVKHRMRVGIVLATLVSCAFFAAKAATTLLSSGVVAPDQDVAIPRERATERRPRGQQRHDPTVILRRNIFNSALGDLSVESTEPSELPDAEILPTRDVEEPCESKMRLIGTVVLPGELEQSLAAIVGSDDKAGLHRGGTEVEGSRIRAILSDSVVLQTTKGFCRLAMFEVEGADKKPVVAVAKPSPTRDSKRRSLVDRNAGLSDDEIEQGIEKVNDTNYNISRTMLSKVLDNAGRLIGIAAVAPKMEGGRSVGMEIRGIRPNTLLTKLGIQNGDVLESVNGQSLTSTDAALGAYTTLRTADKFNLAIRRGDQSMIINYNLQ